MLKDANVGVVLAAKDLQKAKQFYGGKLGFEAEPSDDPTGVLYKSGQSKFYVYQSDFAGTNKATAAAWMVDDVPGAVDELKLKGISFEHYDIPGATHEGDIHVIGKTKAAWFKDPDGNILNVVNMG